MKKIFAIALALSMLFALTACSGGEQSTEPALTTEGTTPVTTQVPTEQILETAAPMAAKGFAFTANGVELIPGADFDAAVLGEAASVYQVPSCALEGTDNVYDYTTFEVTAFNDGTGEIIYAIALLDPNITTDEGLALGDDLAKVIELYGEEYAQNGTAMVYGKGSTILTVIVQDDYVVDIELRMAD